MYEHLKADLGDGLTEGELYTWALRKRDENREHQKFYPRHEFCRVCDNCKVDDSRWRCLCSSGKRMVSPYRIRFQRSTDKPNG